MNFRTLKSLNWPGHLSRLPHPLMVLITWYRLLVLLPKVLFSLLQLHFSFKQFSKSVPVIKNTGSQLVLIIMFYRHWWKVYTVFIQSFPPLEMWSFLEKMPLYVKEFILRDILLNKNWFTPFYSFLPGVAALKI